MRLNLNLGPDMIKSSLALPTLCLAGGLALLAQSMAVTTALAASDNQIIVEKSHSKRISLKSPAGSVIVGNPDIADVNIIDSYTIYIVGRGYGSSSVTVTDRMGRSIFDGEVVVSAPHQGSVTVYSGKTATLMICNQICVPQETNADTMGQFQDSPIPTTSFPTVESNAMVGLNPVP